MKKFINLFKKVNGMEQIKEYMRARVLIYACVHILITGFSKKSLEISRLAISNKVMKKLRKKNAGFCQQFVSEFDMTKANQPKENIVWFCWMQGLENAPTVVKHCYQSVLENFSDKEIILITEDNYREYVTFPDFIQEKIDQGLINGAHFSDLLRLELLINYGGIWTDATVLYTGNQLPVYKTDSDLFMFQVLKPGLDGHPRAFSSWYMCANKNNPILQLTKELLYHYWMTHNALIDYFLVHDFLQLAREAFPEEANKIIPVSSSTPHILLLRLFEKFDKKTWDAITEQTNIHKLTYKFAQEETLKENTYYSKVIKG